MVDVPLPRTWWIHELRVLAGPYPGAPREEDALKKLASLLDAGVRTFVNLQELDERGRRGAPFPDYTLWLESLANDVHVVHVPVKDHAAPTPSEVKRALSAISDEGITYVHCWGGHGRTGTIAGCYLRELGLSAESALARIQDARAHDQYLCDRPSPQTAEQRRVIETWSSQTSQTGLRWVLHEDDGWFCPICRQPHGRSGWSPRSGHYVCDRCASRGVNLDGTRYDHGHEDECSIVLVDGVSCAPNISGMSATGLSVVTEDGDRLTTEAWLARCPWGLDKGIRDERWPRVHRARGCLIGQIAGDSLGSLVESMDPESIRAKHPYGVGALADGGTWNTIAGQPTGGSEMAIALARELLRPHANFGKGKGCDTRSITYALWLASQPFDVGATICQGLVGRPNAESQANGSLMRAAPLGIYGARKPLHTFSPRSVASMDAAITHPHPICMGVNSLYVHALSWIIRQPIGGSGDHLVLVRNLYPRLLEWASHDEFNEDVREALRQVLWLAEDGPPHDYMHQQGWVLTAFHNAVYQLLHAPSFADGVIDTVMRGGDTGTNAAIAGALLGAVYGIIAVPRQWVSSIVLCRPEQGAPGVQRPRPREYWPNDALGLAEHLVT